MGFHEADAVVWNVRLGRIVLLSQRKDRGSCTDFLHLCRGDRFMAVSIKLVFQVAKLVLEGCDQLRNIFIE